ncbi:MAG TPA: four helix bundle protein [Terriglobales bacterium]|nr:four helix bundle protein [Terriglobales bacterium]
MGLCIQFAASILGIDIGFLLFVCCHPQKLSIERGTVYCGDAMGDSYKDLIAWRKAMHFVREIYRATKAFPKEELYGLTNQLRRAAVSVPSNLAEGQARVLSQGVLPFSESCTGIARGNRDSASNRRRLGIRAVRKG